SLAAVAWHDGKPEKARRDPQRDPLAARRVAAVEALSHAGLIKDRPEAHPLLQDADLLVRQRAALALALAGEKDAVPVLIDLLAPLPPVRGQQAEALLLRLAGDTAPSVALGKDDASRSRCRDAWAAWWQEQGGKVDLAQLQRVEPWHGYTLMVLLDAGRVVEVD